MRKCIVAGVAVIVLATWNISTVVAQHAGEGAGGGWFGGGGGHNDHQGGGWFGGGGHHDDHQGGGWFGGGGHHDDHHDDGWFGGGGHHDDHHDGGWFGGGGRHNDHHDGGRHIDYDDGGYPEYQYVQPRTTYYRPPTNQLPMRRQGSGLPIKIVNPSANQVPIAYSLNQYSYTCQPGHTQTIVDNGSWTVKFDRGGNFGVARYAMHSGTYTFKPTSRGWELYHAPLHQAAAPPSPGTFDRPVAQ